MEFRPGSPAWVPSLVTVGHLRFKEAMVLVRVGMKLRPEASRLAKATFCAMGQSPR